MPAGAAGSGRKGTWKTRDQPGRHVGDGGRGRGTQRPAKRARSAAKHRHAKRDPTARARRRAKGSAEPQRPPKAAAAPGVGQRPPRRQRQWGDRQNAGPQADSTSPACTPAAPRAAGLRQAAACAPAARWEKRGVPASCVTACEQRGRPAEAVGGGAGAGGDDNRRAAGQRDTKGQSSGSAASSGTPSAAVGADTASAQRQGPRAAVGQRRGCAGPSIRGSERGAGEHAIPGGIQQRVTDCAGTKAHRLKWGLGAPSGSRTVARGRAQIDDATHASAAPVTLHCSPAATPPAAAARADDRLSGMWAATQRPVS